MAHTSAPAATTTAITHITHMAQHRQHPPARLWLVRHALPVPPALAEHQATTQAAPAHGAGLPGLAPRVASAHCYGHTNWPADPALTHQAATALAHALAHELAHAPARGLAGIHPHPAWRLRCSTLQRCELLALDLKGLMPNLALEFDARLTELNFGAWEGLPWDRVPRAELDAWAAHFGTHRMGGHGETAHELVQRVAHAAHEAAHADPPDALWVTHAGVIRAVHWLAQRGWPRNPPPPQAQDWPTWAPAFGGWCTVSLPIR